MDPSLKQILVLLAESNHRSATAATQQAIAATRAVDAAERQLRATLQVSSGGTSGVSSAGGAARHVKYSDKLALFIPEPSVVLYAAFRLNIRQWMTTYSATIGSADAQAAMATQLVASASSLVARAFLLKYLPEVLERSPASALAIAHALNISGDDSAAEQASRTAAAMEVVSSNVGSPSVLLLSAWAEVVRIHLATTTVEEQLIAGRVRQGQPSPIHASVGPGETVSAFARRVYETADILGITAVSPEAWARPFTPTNMFMGGIDQQLGSVIHPRQSRMDAGAREEQD